ncbi:hypothetical protein FXF51_01880 [Nonomuraea sp. PA05]|uniref:hypothetical protein n=1 Tax=Nonomuraea sp. PA05 TaxID=2604466 RepID=UPI0011D47241|nr:hypothetical protein [Nonomuraea sp. PA05]TYB71210.1 hypothetical protein FXF51_01880 [Nonomuraea sp. PA05]
MNDYLDTKTLLYTAPDGTYFDVIDALPDAPAGSVIVNVSGILFGLEPDDLAQVLAMLGPNAQHGQITIPISDPDGTLWLTATSDPHGLILNVSFPACGSNGQVTLPHDQADAVRAAVEEVTSGE